MARPRQANEGGPGGRRGPSSCATFKPADGYQPEAAGPWVPCRVQDAVRLKPLLITELVAPPSDYVTDAQAIAALLNTQMRNGFKCIACSDSLQLVQGQELLASRSIRNDFKGHTKLLLDVTTVHTSTQLMKKKLLNLLAVVIALKLVRRFVLHSTVCTALGFKVTIKMKATHMLPAF
eukprot:6213511-Pleurochrysis_carterae.AAC.3